MAMNHFKSKDFYLRLHQSLQDVENSTKRRSMLCFTGLRKGNRIQNLSITEMRLFLSII